MADVLAIGMDGWDVVFLAGCCCGGNDGLDAGWMAECCFCRKTKSPSKMVFEVISSTDCMDEDSRLWKV